MLDLPLGRPRVGFAAVVVFVDALDLGAARVAGLVSPLTLLLDLNFIRPSSASLVTLPRLTLAPTAAWRVLRLGGTGVGGAVDRLELERADAGVDEGVGMC